MSNPSYIITGRKDSGCYDRLEIEELQKQPKQFTLFVLAFLALQGRPFEVPGVKPLPTPEIPSPVQFPELAGIHGLPFKEWIGDANKYASDFDLKDPKDTEPVPSRFGGYCNHGSVVFPTWHRPYVMAIEQAIGDIATQLAENFAINYPKDSPEEWRKAARELRFPFWDWAAKKVRSDGVPSVLTDSTVEIVMPGAVKVPVSNPLAFYPFQSIPEGFEDEILDPKRPAVKAYFSKWKRTFRYAKSTPTPGDSNVKMMNEKIKQSALQVRRHVSDLFTFPDRGDSAKIWDEFSNHTTESLRKMDYRNLCSLEGIHDLMHDLMGGNGHMSDPDYAGFDPIFYLHHCNVDRLLAFWEYVYPDYFMGEGYTYDGRTYPFTQARGTYSLVYNSKLIESTSLAPFRTEEGGYWTSTKAHFLDEKYYSYPTVDGVKIGDPISGQELLEARKKLQKFYGVDAPTELEGIHFENFPGAPGSGYEVVEKYRRMVIIVQTSEFAFNGPYSVRICYKSPGSQDEMLVGIVAIFARPDRSPCAGCSMRRDAGSTVRGVVPVPLSIVQHISQHVLAGEHEHKEIVEAFKDGLHASILNRNGDKVGHADGRRVSEGDSLASYAAPEITLVSSAATYRRDGDWNGPIEWFDFENLGKVFEGHRAWKAV